MLAVHFENSWQNQKVKTYQQHLEELVRERTAQLEAEIATRMKAEEELQISRKHYQDLVETSQDLVWQCDAQGRFTYINGAWENVLGYRLGEMLGHIFTEFQDEKTARQDLGELQYLLEGNSDSKYESIYRAKDGREVNLVFNAKYFTDEHNKVLGAQGTAYDITERKLNERELREARDLLEQRVAERTTDLQAANEALEKSSRMKDEFMASMSHELRTPLTGVLGLSEVLQMQTYGALTDKQMTALKSIEKSGRQLLEIINSILDYSMLEAGKLQLQLTPCSLSELCENSLHVVEKLAQDKKLRSFFNIDPSSIILNVDTRRLKQALVCLLSNAVKFTPEGGSFGIEVRGLAREQRALICVWDTGIGIRDEDFPRLFQPFIQLDARLSREFNGIGLGLALVRRLVELQGGSVGVESRLEEGSRFTISLPWAG